MTPEISIIYVNYNCATLIRDSLESLLQKCETGGLEVIVVDNASSTVDKQLLAELAEGSKPFLEVKNVFLDQNLGFGSANNVGARAARGQFFFFLNPDTLFLNDAIEILHTFLKNAPAFVAACGGSLFTVNNEPTAAFGNFPGIGQEIGQLGLGFSLALDKLFNGYHSRRLAVNSPALGKYAHQVPYILGADIFIRRTAFEAAGGFDEQFFMYYEETDLFFRLQKIGLQGWMVPEAKIVHLEGGSLAEESRPQFSLKKFSMLLESKVLYYAKWYRPFYRPLIKLLILMQIIVQYAKGNMGRELRPLLRIYKSKTSRARSQQQAF